MEIQDGVVIIPLDELAKVVSALSIQAMNMRVPFSEIKRNYQHSMPQIIKDFKISVLNKDNQEPMFEEMMDFYNALIE